MIADAVPVRSRCDPVTGLWTLTAPADTLGRPVVTGDGDAVFLLVGGQPTALDPATGKVRWRAAERLPAREDASPVLRPAGSRLVIASDEPGRYRPEPVTLTGLDTADGTRAWVRDGELLSGFLTDEPSNTLLLWQGHDAAPQHLTAVDLTDGTVRWRHEFRGVDRPVLVGERVIASVSAGLRAFDVGTGTELWRDGANVSRTGLRLRRGGAGEPVVAAVLRCGELLAIAPDTGERLRTRRCPSNREWVDVRGAGTALWFNRLRRSFWPGHLLVREPVLGSARPGRFLIRRPLATVSWDGREGLDPIELDGRIYAVLQRRQDFTPWRRVLGFAGQSVHTARTGRALALLRPLPGRPVRRGGFVDMCAGPDRLYLSVHHREHSVTLAYRNGRVLWSAPETFRALVPIGDRLLVLTDEDHQDHLRLIDGETGERCHP